MNIKVIKNNRTGGWLTKVEIETINKLENVGSRYRDARKGTQSVL